MYNFFELGIIPTFLSGFEVKKVLMIGLTNETILNEILSYCINNNAELYTIDSNSNINDLINKNYITYDNLDNFKETITHFNEKSLDILPDLKSFDTIFIDDDPNWYTVYNEFELIKKNNPNFPLVFVCNNKYPYKRRDAYTNPKDIPKKYINECSTELPIIFEENGQTKNIMINDNLCHALYENTPKNGVLTAIEDFLNENPSLKLLEINPLEGIYLIYEHSKDNEIKINKILEKKIRLTYTLGDLSDKFIENDLLLNYVDEINEFKSEIDDELKEYKDKIDIYDTQINYKNSQLNNIESQINLKETQIKNVEAKLINKNNEIETNKHKLKTTQDRLNNLETNFIYNKKELDNLNNQLKNKNKKINSLKSEIQNVEAKLNNEIKNKEKELASKNSEIETNKNTLKTTKNRLNNLETKSTNHEKEINHLNYQLKNKNKEVNSLKSQINDENNKFNSLKVKYNKQSDILRYKKHCINCYEKEIDNNATEIEYLKNNNKISKKIISPFSYLYIIMKSKPQEIKTNIKLFNVLKNSDCFDKGYYLNKYHDILKSRICKFFSPELHYVIYGFNENRKINNKSPAYKNKNMLIEYIKND